jgi:hypothetical protein
MNSDYKIRGLKNDFTSIVHTLPMNDVRNGQISSMALSIGYWPSGSKESPVYTFYKDLLGVFVILR